MTSVSNPKSSISEHSACGVSTEGSYTISAFSASSATLQDATPLRADNPASIVPEQFEQVMPVIPTNS